MQYAIIVDAIVSGNGLAYETVSRGIKCIHVYSSIDSYQKNFNTLNTLFFEKGLIYTTDDDLLNYIKSNDIEIVFCVPGSDYGVVLANHLCKVLGLPYNNVQFDRYSVQKSMGEECDDKDFQKFLEKHKKCIVKPKLSFGGYDRIRIVNNTENIEDVTGFYITPFYVGNEYSVDFVSYKGKHKIVSVWKYIKDGINPFWREKTELLHYEENKELIDSIYNYMDKLLTVLGYQNGATHSEVIITSEGVRLVEVNFRTHGSMDYIATSKALDRNHPQLTIDALTHNDTMFETLGPKYNTKSNIIRVNFFNNRERPFNKINWEGIRKLESHSTSYFHYTPYQIVPVSEYTIRSIPAKIVFVNTDLSKLQTDIKTALEIFNE